MRASVRKGREVTLSFAVAKRKPEKKKINKKHACTGFEPLASAIPVQRSNKRRYFAMIIGKADTPTNEDLL